MEQSILGLSPKSDRQLLVPAFMQQVKDGLPQGMSKATFSLSLTNSG